MLSSKKPPAKKIPNFAGMKVPQLKKAAKKLGIDTRGMLKADLVALCIRQATRIAKGK